MDTLSPVSFVFRFGSYELNIRERELRKHGVRVRLQEQPFQVLAVLLETPGELVTREELRCRVWPQDTFVDFDHALNTAVKKIRAVLSDDADAPRYVETVPRRGYRFIAPVNAAPSTGFSALEGDDSTEPQRHLWTTEIFSSRIAVGGLLATVVILALVFQLTGLRRKAALAAAMRRPVEQVRVMVAVLPFQNISADPAQEYFSDGMTEETISQLGQLNPEHLAVIARTSAMKYKNAGKTVEEIGKELHVEYVVEGSVRREGPRVRIAAQLIRTSDQAPRWAMNFDRNINDVLSLQTEVASAIANDIEKTLGNTAPLQAIPYTPPVVPDAYEYYLRGMSEGGFRSRKEFDRVLTTFGSAVKMDPTCAMNYAGLASAYDQAGNGGLLPPREAFAKTKEAATKAIELNPADPDAHVYLADAILTVDFDWAEAEKQIQRALKLNPNDANARQWYGLFLLFKGETDEGFAEMKRALTLDPLSTERMVYLGVSAMMAGRPAEAQFYLKMAIGIDPDLSVAHKYLAYAYEAQGKKEVAINEMAEAYRSRGATEALATLKQTYASAGYEAAKKAGLRQDIVFWKKATKDSYLPAFFLAEDYGVLGDKEETIAWLQRAYDVRDIHLLCVRSEQNLAFASVKDDPRFQAIVAKLGYPQ